MAESKCTNCGGKGEFDPQLAFARLSSKHDKLADVLTRFMASTAATPDTVARVAIAEQLTREVERILGGRPTDAFPECCLIGHRNSNGTISWFCSGVLIHAQIVLTAGHCFLSDERANVVALATSNQNQLEHAELLNIRRLAVHPRYQQTRQISDMTVVILRTPAVTPPIPIATTPELSDARQMTLVGFGNEDINSTKGFGVKREVEVDIRSIRRAATDDLDTDEHLLGYESDLEFVAGGKGFDTCNGDSGGPVYVVIDGGRKLAGITSRATETAVHACGDGGIYTRIDVHLDFIRQVARDAGITTFE
ncbi:S1 family peptidase [Paraburkholderia sp. RL17-347-BIC-D]|uniref:S1 family peptidase n=1 Tax=Paraburkholderia sp. RL17-347-BIC-D TaxID=3031632 RepID=UPI0038B791EE